MSKIDDNISAMNSLGVTSVIAIVIVGSLTFFLITKETAPTSTVDLDTAFDASSTGDTSAQTKVEVSQPDQTLEQTLAFSGETIAQVPDGYYLYKNQELHVEFLIPEDWDQTHITSGSTYILKSPTYKDSGLVEGYGDPTILAGEQITFQQTSGVAESIAEPTKYVAWLKSHLTSTSNYKKHMDVIIGGIPALQSTYRDTFGDSLDDEFIKIQFVRDSLAYELGFHASEFNGHNFDIFDKAFRSFHFTDN